MIKKPSANEILAAMSAYALDVSRIEASIAEARKTLGQKHEAMSAFLVSAMSETNAATQVRKGDILATMGYDRETRGEKVKALYVVLGVVLGIKPDLAHSWAWDSGTNSLNEGNIEGAASAFLRRKLITKIVKKNGSLGLQEIPSWRVDTVVGRVHEDLIPSLDSTFVLSGRDKVEFLSERARQKLGWKE